MNKLWPTKIMFQIQRTGSQYIGLGSSHLNNFHIFETLGMLVVLLDIGFLGYVQLLYFILMFYGKTRCLGH